MRSSDMRDRVSMRDISAASPARVRGDLTSGRHGAAALLALKLCAVSGLALVTANCAQQPQQSRLTRQESREVGFFSGRQWGTASPRVVGEGDAVPKGGGRDHVGRTYTIAGKRYTPYVKPTGYTITGAASWYGAAFHGRKTANGEVYDRHGISAAHPTMPLPSYARVTNLSNRRSIIVRVNDRGPYHGGRVIDLSQKTAELLEFRHLGTARVRVEYLGRASLAGSDDRRLIASLSTDGAPATIPGMSTPAPTMVASAPPMTPRVSAPAAVEAPVEQTSFALAAAPQPAVQPAVTPASETTRVVRNAPLPPARPFDLATIPGAGVPTAFAGAGSSQVATRTAAPRPVVASLFYAKPDVKPQVFSRSHPLARDLTAQRFVPLAER